MPNLFAVGEIISALSETRPVRIGRPFPSFQMLHPRRRVRRRRRGDREQGATKGRCEGSPGNRSALRRSIRKDRYETHDHPHWRDRAPCDPCCRRRRAERLCTGDRPPRSERTSAGLAPKLRSEEHTSELPSLMRLSYAVFCLKKKTSEHKS